MTETSLQSPAQRVLEAMGRYTQLAHALRLARLTQPNFWADLHLTLPQLKTLGIIAAAGVAGRSGRDLAALLGVGPSAVTPLVDRLVEHGYATRHEDAVDRRVLRVRVTAAGQALLDRLNIGQTDELADVVARIPAADLPLVERALEVLTEAAAQAVAASEPAVARSRPTAVVS